MTTDLRARTDAELSMVDASSDWKAEVSVPLPRPFLQELNRHALSKSAWNRILSPWKALQRARGVLDPNDELPDGPLRAHPVWAALAASQKFECKDRRKVRGSKHINLSEMDAFLECEARRGRCSPSSRLHIASDSQVVCGAITKGRSSSKCLNSRLRKSLPTLLGFGSYSYIQYVQSHANPADDPTRCREVREPSIPEPDWLKQALAGDFASMDDMLAKCELDDLAAARLPVYTAPGVAAVEKLTDRKLERRAFFADRARQGGKTKVAVSPPAFRAEPWMPADRLSDQALLLLERLPKSQFVFPRNCKDKTLTRRGHLDLFSGSRGAARALANKTGKWVLTYDIRNSSRENLLDRDIQLEIEKLVEADCFYSMAAGPVCSSFSRAVRPAVRSRLCPYGLPNVTSTMGKKIHEGNVFAIWLASLTLKANSQKMIIWIENPWLSFLWDLEEWQKVASHPGFDFFLTDYCRYGAGWRKRTRFLTNTCLKNQKHPCKCTSPHIRLTGYSVQHGVSWTKAAEAYPSSLCRLLAAAVAEGMKPVNRQKKLDIAGCCKSCGRRTGEAANPGPRRRQRPLHAPSTLDEVPMVQAATRLVQDRAYQQFLDWLQSELPLESWEWVRAEPSRMLLFLRAFGMHLYSRSGPMYVFRHLVVLLQQQFPDHRGRIREGWDLLARWEVAQPVSHRPPLPKVILDSMLALAISWGWLRWSGILILAFYGAMRVGEPLRAVRADLLLADEAAFTESVCFLKIRSPKSGRRGKGVTQHARIRDPLAVFWISHVFRDVPRDQLLYPASPATFRKRWDVLLASLNIPKAAQLTPGGVRGGGAIYMYHSDLPLLEILWRMRLRQLSTLESYVQELAAENLFVRLPQRSRDKILACSSIFPHLVQSFKPT